jgi:nucleoside phosphorylase
LGDVIIAESVVDLAVRKIQLDQEGISGPEFRPRVFSTDMRLVNYLNYSGFQRPDWQARVFQEIEWPEHRRPAIQTGTIASADEVVSSNEWSERLLAAWPKLLGVEMEAGGACAAAELFDLKVVVIRGVSDYADPAKSDNEWRKRAMRTVIHLLRSVEFGAILQSSG